MDILKNSVHFPLSKTHDEITKNAFLMAESFYLEQEKRIKNLDK